MKKFFAIMLVMGLSQVAFAATYDCDVLKDASGPIDGGPKYAVDYDGGVPSLKVTTGADEDQALTSQEYPMTSTGKFPEGAMFSEFEAQGVTVNIEELRVLGYPSYRISVSKKIGDKEFTASCELPN